jgi:hypothetical protein
MIQSVRRLTKQRNNVKIKILQCQNDLLWYNNHIGEEFDVTVITDNCYWAKVKPEIFNCINWVYRDDATITEGNIK